MSEPEDTYATMTRVSDPGTSHQAAFSWSEAHLSEVQQRIGEILQAALPGGLTHEEQHARYWALWPTAESSPRKRCCDLVRMGLVKDSGERRKLKSGRMGIVWVWVGVKPSRRHKSLYPPPPVVEPKKR